MPDGRRWSDAELKEIAALIRKELPPVYEFTNGQRRRTIINWTMVGGIAVILGLVQTWALRPLEAKISHAEDSIGSVATSVRQHHENSPLIYVTRDQYNIDQQNLMRELRALRDLIILTEQREDRR